MQKCFITEHLRGHAFIHLFSSKKHVNHFVAIITKQLFYIWKKSYNQIISSISEYTSMSYETKLKTNKLLFNITNTFTDINILSS